MPKNSLCLICLRADVNLKVVDKRLIEFHGELCIVYSCFSMETDDPKYCMVCEHLLRKLYNFKEKCALAITILQEWKVTELEKKPLNQLYTLLPESGLGVWTPNNSKIFDYEEAPSPMSNNKAKHEAFLNNSTSKETVLNVNMPRPAPAPKINTKWSLIKNPIKIEDIIVEKDCKDSLGFEDTQSQNEDDTEVEDHSDNTSLNGDDNVEKYIFIDSLNINDIKTDVLDDSSINSDDFREIDKALEESSSDDSDDKDKERKSNSTKNKSLAELANISLSDDDFVTDDDTEKTCNITCMNIKGDKDKDKNQKHEFKSNELLTELANISFSDDEIFTNNDTEVKCNTKNKTKNKSDKDKGDEKIKKLNSYDIYPESDISLSEEEITNAEIELKCFKSKKSIEWDKRFDEAANKIIANLENWNADLEAIQEGYKNILKNDTDKSVTEKNSLNTKGRHGKISVKRVTNISKKIDSMQKSCETMIAQYGDERSASIKTLLIPELKARFELWELKPFDGGSIDKEHILSCLDGRVSELVLVQLWSALQRRKKFFSKEALRILWTIQNRNQKKDYESVFTIEYMNTAQEMKAEVQNRKSYECYIMAKYKCEKCYLGFGHSKQLEAHMKMHVKSRGSAECPICGVHAGGHSRYKHRKSHEAVYKCKNCPLVTYNRHTMMNHYNQHKGVKYECQPCNKTFRSASAYNTHRGYAHRRAHVCTTCGRTFETEEIRDAHQKAHRVQPTTDGSTSVKCDACELSFPSQAVYERHARFSHGFHWLSRKKSISAREKLNPLMKKLYFTCPMCKAAGSSYSWLVLHVRSEHNADVGELNAHKRIYLCDVCGRGFMNRYNLRDHLNTHTGVRPYACELCPKRFTTPMSRKNHQQYHFPPTHKCTRCEKMFHSSSNLFSHMRTHIRDRRFKCNICGKGFIHSGMLREHIRGVHNNVRRVRKRGGTEVGVGAGEPGESGGARSSTAARTKRRRRREEESTDESSDSD